MVINGKVDVAGLDRGNMRVWETLGCGAMLITDTGRYPRGMEPGLDFATYDGKKSLVSNILEFQNDVRKLKQMAANGHRTIRTTFSKEAQWLAFEKLCS